MSSFTGRLRRLVLRIPEQETKVSRRGFRCDDAAVRARIESIGRTFVAGYHLAIEAETTETLHDGLEAVDNERRGWAYEGAGFGLAVLDGIARWRSPRLPSYVEGIGAPHVYMVYVGAGWALARFPRRTERTLARLDPLLRWLAIDGYGFHEGYFHWRRYAGGGRAPAHLEGVARRVFDQGLGRSLWFVGGADVQWIADTIQGFAERRRADLWSGVGLACAYAGGVERDVVTRLADCAGRHHADAAQGAAFAAKARLRAGNPAAHTEMAVEILCRTTSEHAAAITDRVHAALPGNGAAIDGSAYEAWRAGVRDEFASGLRVEVTT